MSVLRPLVALAAATLLLPGATPATNPRDFRWNPLIRVHGPHDVVGPRADGRLVIATSRGLFLYRRGGRATPFARGEGGYVPVLGEILAHWRGTAACARPAAGSGATTCSFSTRSRTRASSRSTKRGRATRFVSFPGALLAGITFDQFGRFGSRLLVAARVANELTLYGIDCRGRAEIVLEHGPRSRAESQSPHAVSERLEADFVAADEFSGKIYAFDQRGGQTIVATPRLPVGATSASRPRLRAQGIQPARRVRIWPMHLRPVRRRKEPTAYSPSLAQISCAPEPGQAILLVATEAGARTLRVRCRLRCTVREIGRGPAATHGEGHVTFITKR